MTLRFTNANGGAVELDVRAADDGVAYAKRLTKASVPIGHRNYAGTIHGFVTILVNLDLVITSGAIATFSAELRAAFGQ